jgi:hypothetical protein
MGRRRRERTRALVDVDDVIVRAENIIIVGDRRNNDNGLVAGVEDTNNRINPGNGNVQDIIDDILDDVCRRY